MAFHPSRASRTRPRARRVSATAHEIGNTNREHPAKNKKFARPLKSGSPTADDHCEDPTAELTPRNPRRRPSIPHDARPQLPRPPFPPRCRGTAMPVPAVAARIDQPARVTLAAMRDGGQCGSWAQERSWCTNEPGARALHARGAPRGRCHDVESHQQGHPQTTRPNTHWIRRAPHDELGWCRPIGASRSTESSVWTGRVRARSR